MKSSSKFHNSEVTPVDDYDLIFCLVDYFLFIQLNEINTGGELSNKNFSLSLLLKSSIKNLKTTL